MSQLKVGIGQIHPLLGNIESNSTKILNYIKKASSEQCDLVVFGELALTGYPPEDLLYKSDFVEKNLQALQIIAQSTKDCGAIVGFVDQDPDDRSKLFNAAALCFDGKVQGVYHKQKLPNNSVFDEKRYFSHGDDCQPFEFKGKKIGLTICEDIWDPESPAFKAAENGAEVTITINGSPFHKSIRAERNEVAKKVVHQTNKPLVYVNLVGGQDELLFDGHSFILNKDGQTEFQASGFKEELLIHTISSPQKETKSKTRSNKFEPNLGEIWNALTLGFRSYVLDNGFSKTCVGLSGGIDSALTTVIAVDAIGAENVKAVLMPSRYSSDHSINDSIELCKNLGVEYFQIPIEKAHGAFQDSLANAFNDEIISGLVDENLQSRIRGVILMAFSNRFNCLVAATGNKSELAVGYSTLYGDTVGAYAVIKDLWKTQVYDLANWYNQQGRPEIPQNIIHKPASAELRPDQRDNQTLPPYDVLDKILKQYVELDLSAQDIIEYGFEKTVVNKVVELVNRAEYKRRQCPIGTRISKKAFGKDRRMPITNLYCD